MDQDNPVGSGGGFGSGGGSTTGSDVGSASGSSSGGGISGGGFGSSGAGSTGGGTSTSGSGGSMSTGGGSDAADAGTCPTCGQSRGRGLEQFLARLGITTDMMDNLKGQFQNVDIDEYMNTAREYLKDGSSKATSYAKDNPGKVAAGVAALALGAGLIYAAANRDKA